MSENAVWVAISPCSHKPRNVTKINETKDTLEKDLKNMVLEVLVRPQWTCEHKERYQSKSNLSTLTFFFENLSDLIKQYLITSKTRVKHVTVYTTGLSDSALDSRLRRDKVQLGSSQTKSQKKTFWVADRLCLSLSLSCSSSPYFHPFLKSKSGENVPGEKRKHLKSRTPWFEFLVIFDFFAPWCRQRREASSVKIS